MRYHYITLSDLSTMIRKNIYKVPHDIDFVIGVPRSGMIPACIIAEFLNVAVIDVDSFIHGAQPTGGNRLHFRQWRAKPHPKVLVIDDTVFSGTAMLRTKEKLQPFAKEFNFIYAAAYLEGRGANVIDFWLDDDRQYTNNFTIPVLYEWNIFHHYTHVENHCAYDIDGVLCLDPPDERNEQEYLNYIANATPLFCPTTPISTIITYRLIKNREITTKWLAQQGVQYKELIMFNAETWQERNNSGIGPAEFKAKHFKENPNLYIFIESDDNQARRIHELTGKQVLCVETNKMYG